MAQASSRAVSLAPAALLERADDLAVLSRSLEGVAASLHGRVVLVAGEAGVGKTALLRRFCDDQDRAARILWGACDPLFTPRPLGPLLDVAEAIGGEPAELVERGARPNDLAAALLRELQARAPSILVLEDVHWADEATLDVLRLLARRIERAPALVLASYRDDELDRTHPLSIVLGELVRGESVDRLKLAPLSLAGVAELAEPHGVDAAALHRNTAGNPFFVVEALAAAEDEIPHTVRDAVLARAARLSTPARVLAEAVAIAPPHAELWLLDAIAGELVDHLDECLASGMLSAVYGGVAFRHELARLAVEESVAPTRKAALHRKALAALSEPPTGVPDLARLAHHAEQGGDADAVLRFAPAAAVRAASLGAHREAAAQYARALRFADGAAAGVRAELLVQRAQESYVTDQNDEAIEAAKAALGHYRALDDKAGEGNALRVLAEILWCPGRTTEAEQASRDAVSVLEGLPPRRALALAYSNLCVICKDAEKVDEAAAWGERALELAERLDDSEIVVHALTSLGSAQLLAGSPGGVDKLEHALDLAMRMGLDSLAGRTYVNLASLGVRIRDYPLADRYLDAGVAYCSEHGLELPWLYLLAYRARSELDRGRWTEAADSSASVVRVRRASTTPRIVALVVLGLVRARRGDPDVWAPLDEARALAEPTGELPRIGPVAAARAEAAWLEGAHGGIAEATDSAFRLALRRKSPWAIGDLATWRRRAGIAEETPVRGAAEPYALELAGAWARAARTWAELGCPYEAALALADADDEDALRDALEQLQLLGAQASAAIVARRLRERGARGLPRGPRPATRSNAAGLTPRELEVLELVAEGLRNGQIADRLVLSERTVDHHVASTLRKLGVGARAQAAAEGVRLGLVARDR